jgi:MoaA/NifB/PqqE/SkfB family radical SAM enzyme
VSGLERDAIDRGWFYVHEPDNGAHVVDARLLKARDGRRLTRRLHGYEATIEVDDQSGADLPVATWLRAAAAAGRAAEHHTSPPPLTLRLGPTGTATRREGSVLHLDGPAIAAAPSHHPLEAEVAPLLKEPWSAPTPDTDSKPLKPAMKLLAFESLLNTDMPHNDKEISQGVLHLLSPLAGQGIEVVMARVKMPIIGDERPPIGLEHLGETLESGIDLVLVTLLEGYWHGAVQLIGHLRTLGCRAHVVVGGVMPTLTPEHVAAHLPGVSFVARGAGEYFVPRLVAALGDSDIDTPFTAAQRAAFRDMRGLIAIDRAGRRLIAARPADTVEVVDLDRVELDLSYLQPRHVEGGIEITTSRGCIHRCSVCSIIGRERYQARSSGSIFELLDTYQRRYDEMFDGPPPPNAYRVHIADDDFACDKERALAFFRELPKTPFRLSSIQVSVADLCVRDAQGTLLPRIDPDWIRVLDPDCFADAHRPIPDAQRLADHSERSWSSFLQIGVETFSERELVRLGKGYRLAHIRAAVDALSRRGLHHDAYFIQCNTDTSATDLLDSVTELCRLKLRYPLHFHLRFPVVPHLVSYFPTATFRKKVRAGRIDSVSLLDHLSVPGHPELDYPLVGHDIPDDPLVEAAVDAGFLTDARRYTDSLVTLHRLWSEAGAPEPLLRRLDDLPRRLVFELLTHARTGERGERPDGWSSAPDTQLALQAAEAVLGPKADWLPAFQRHASQTAPRLVVIPTWQCELRCNYCYIPKQDGRVMDTATTERAVDFLLSSDRSELILQFFGGEALLEYPRVQHAIAVAHERAQAAGKRIQFILSSNGWSLDPEKLAWLAQYPVKLELSLDGATETQNKFRHSRERTGDSYTTGIAPRAADIIASGLDYDIIMVVHPLNAHLIFENFFHIADLGFRRLQINPALGPMWKPAQVKALSEGLFQIGAELKRRWADGDALVFINAENRPMPVRLNGEVTVDYDGTIYGGNGFLHETEHKDRFIVGHLDDAKSFDRYWFDVPSNEFLLKYSYPPDVTRNNLAVGRMMRSFCLWLRGESDPAPSRRARR